VSPAPRRRPPRRSGIPLFRIGPITVAADPSWFIAVLFIGWYYGSALGPQLAPGRGATIHLLLGIATALGLFASVLVHELSHSVVSWKFGKPVYRIRLFLFGGVSELSEEPDRPLHEFLIAIVGPLTSLLLGVALVAAAIGLGLSLDGGPSFAAPGRPIALAGVLLHLGIANGILGVFNLLPGFPLDGGRCLRAALWARNGDLLGATRVATLSGKGVGLLLIAAGAVFASFNDLFQAVFLALIGFFLHAAAGSSYRATRLRHSFGKATVGQAMTPTVVAVEASLPVDRLVAEYFLRYRYGAFPVLSDSAPVGLVSITDLSGISPDDWPRLRVADLARPLDGAAVSPHEPLHRAYRNMAESRLASLLVVDEGRLVGILSQRDLQLALLSQGAGLGDSLPNE